MRKILLLALVAGIFMSCSSTKITINMDGSLDFNSYKTYSYYGWDTAGTKISKYLQREIEYSFVEEFGARGMKFDPDGNGDVVVSLFLVINVDKQTKAYSNYYNHNSYGFNQPAWGWGYGYGSPYSYGGVVYEESNYYTGTLVCDIFDRKTKNLAWQGVVSKAVEPTSTNKAKNIQVVISKLMRDFPKAKLSTK